MTLQLTDEQVEDFRHRTREVATRLFVDRGYDGVTLRAIAHELGVSRSTPYSYYESKEHILADIRGAALKDFREATEAALASPEAGAGDVLAGCRAYVRFAVESPARYKLMFDHFQADQGGALAKHGPSARELLPRLGETLAATLGASEEPKELAFQMWSALHGAVSLHLGGQLQDEMEIDALVESLVSSLVRGWRRTTQEEEDP